MQSSEAVEFAVILDLKLNSSWNKDTFLSHMQTESWTTSSQWLGRAHQDRVIFLLIFLLLIDTKENYSGKVITLGKAAQGFQDQQNTPACHLLWKLNSNPSERASFNLAAIAAFDFPHFPCSLISIQII